MSRFRMIGVCDSCGEVRNDDVAFEDPFFDRGTCRNCGAPTSDAYYVIAKPKGLFRKLWLDKEGNQVA